MGINNICYIGELHIGVPLCAVLAMKCPEIRLTVLCNPKSVIEWNSDTFTYYEPNLEEIVKKCRNRNLTFSSDSASTIKEADLIFISMTDPSTSRDGKGNPMDFKQLEDTARLITLNSITDKIIVEKSTFSVEASEKINQIFNSLCIPGVHLEVIFCSEFFTEGTAIENLLDPDRIIIGVKSNPKSRAAGRALKELYERWIPSQRIEVINIRSAQIIKLVTNIFVAQRLASVNSLAQICEKSDGDILEIAKCYEKHFKTVPAFWQVSLELEGLGDEISKMIHMYESAKLIESASYWQGTLELNNIQRARFVQRILSVLSPVKGKQIGIWGFSYKKNTSETRFSFAIQICSRLILSGALLKIFDPKVPKHQILKDLKAEFSRLACAFDEFKVENEFICDNIFATCKNSDAIILCTDWDEFRNANFTKVIYLMKTPTFYDTKRCLDSVVLNNCGSGVQLFSAGLGNPL